MDLAEILKSSHGQPLRARLFQIQYGRKPLQFQAMTVSGLTSAGNKPFHQRLGRATQSAYRPTHLASGLLDSPINALSGNVELVPMFINRIHGGAVETVV